MVSKIVVSIPSASKTGIAESGRGRRLSAKQTQILNLLCKGYRNIDIATELAISMRTVKWHVSNLLLLFDVANRTELVANYLALNDKL